MSFPSFAQGNEFLKTRDAQKAGKQRINKHRERFTNNSSYVEAFTSNSNGATAPSTTASASSSKAPSIPAQYQYKNIQRVNRDENNVMKRVLKDVDNSVAIAVNTGQDTTAIANNFLRSNDKNSLANSNVTTVNGVQGAVNSMGIFSTYPSDVASNSNANFASTDLNIPKSMALPINQNNQYKIISSGALNSNNTALLGQSAQMNTVSAQNAIGSYAGQNVYTYDRNPLLGNNISYQGNYTTSLSLARNEITGGTNAKQCFERAADTAAQSGNGGIYAALDNYGNCYTGESQSGSSYQSYSENLELCEVFPGKTITSGVVILGANGGLYDGSPDDRDVTNANLLNKKDLQSDVLSNVDPIYGVAINNVSASFGLSGGMVNKNNMVFNDSVVAGENSNTTGQATATLGTIRTTISENQTCPQWMYEPWYQWLLNWDYGRSIYCPTEEIVNYSSILQPGQSSAEDVTVQHNCGKVTKTLPAQTVYQGTEISLSCLDEMSKYGIMYLEIADNGVVTVTNSATGLPVWSFTPSGNQQALLNQSLPLKNNTTIRLNAQRNDWIWASGVTPTNPNWSTTLFTYPNSGGLTSFAPGEWLSSPSGYCRLINKDNRLIIEYSLYNLALDSSGYAIGNLSNATPSEESYAMYYISGIQPNNLGGLSYVDLNNGVYSYTQPPGGFPLGDSYIESKNYLPMTNKLPSSRQDVTDSTACGNICSNDDSCGGYTVYGGECNTYSTQSLFPNANRMYQEGATTYIRDIKVSQDMTDPSCSKRVANITTDIYNNFGSYITGEPMTTDKKCGMAVVLDSEIQSLNSANANAIAKGQTIQNQMTNIYERQNNAIDDLQMNNMFSHMFEDVIQDVNKAIKKQENNAISKVAAKDNTDLILLSDNYKYIIWGIVTLLLSIAAIKALRVGSS